MKLRGPRIEANRTSGREFRARADTRMVGPRSRSRGMGKRRREHFSDCRALSCRAGLQVQRHGEKKVSNRTLPDAVSGDWFYPFVAIDQVDVKSVGLGCRGRGCRDSGRGLNSIREDVELRLHVYCVLKAILQVVWWYWARLVLLLLGVSRWEKAQSASERDLFKCDIVGFSADRCI